MAGSFLDRWGGFVSVAAAVALGFIIASVPTPLYPLYQAEWQLPPSALSYIFTAYMAGLLVAFLCFGSLSDSLGRLLVVLAALAGIAAGLHWTGQRGADHGGRHGADRGASAA